MDPAQLKYLISQGESIAMEFKTGDARAETLAKEFVAFANSFGGTLLLGVDDNGEILGIANPSAEEERIQNVARTLVHPPIVPDLVRVRVGGQSVLVIQIPKGPDRPYQTQDGRFYIRSGSTNRTASASELMRLFQQAGFFHFDQTPVDDTGKADLESRALADYFGRYELNYAEEPQEEQHRILTNGGILHPGGACTVAGILLFARQPEKHLPQAVVRFAHYAGIEPDAEILDRKEICGRLDEQVEQSFRILRNNLVHPSTLSGVHRVEADAYPDKVYRELIVNACIHRNYAITGSAIRILMFRDRIEFISPGKLPNTITPENLRFGVSFAVNPVILKFMDNLRYTDRLGPGLPMVYRESSRRGHPVEFLELGEEFRVILPLSLKAEILKR